MLTDPKVRIIEPTIGKMKMRGRLTIHVLDSKTGRVLKTIHKQNTITFDAGNIVRGLLAQRATDHAAANLSIASMRFGTDNTTPTRSDTDLIAEVSAVRKQLGDSAKTNGITGEIIFQATLESGDGNGNTFREVALFTRGDTWNNDVNSSEGLEMFSRQINPAVEKTAGITLEYNWGLQFTV